MSKTVILWQICRRLPTQLVTFLMHRIADIVTLLNPEPVKQLRKNHERLLHRPLTLKEVRQAVRSYFRMFGEGFTLANWEANYLRESCLYPEAVKVAKAMREGPVILALTHSGNWDQAGAWFCQNHGQIVTVAEKLTDPKLLAAFVQLREQMGLEILTVGENEHVFDQLVQRIQGRSVLVPLLADRDISGSGVEVTLAGHSALVAAGPAALALKLERPLLAGHIAYEKMRGKWRIRAYFTDPITPPEPKPAETAVEALTREWVHQIEPILVEHVRDWHMMQKVFVEDLDSNRLERAQKRHREMMENEHTPERG